MQQPPSQQPQEQQPLRVEVINKELAVAVIYQPRVSTQVMVGVLAANVVTFIVLILFGVLTV